jgi:hypothetical protein
MRSILSIACAALVTASPQLPTEFPTDIKAREIQKAVPPVPKSMNFCGVGILKAN